MSFSSNLFKNSMLMNDEKTKELDPRLKFSFTRGQRTYYKCSNCRKLSYLIDKEMVSEHTEACNVKFKREKNSDATSTKLGTSSSTDTE